MPSSLPLLALAAPRVLLPTARISVPVDKQTAIAAHALFQAAPDGHALVAAVPALAAPIADNEGLTPSDDTSGPVSLAKWGTVARITRVLKSAVARGKGATYFVFLAGTGTRVRILQAETSTSEDSLPSIAVEYVKDSSQPAREIVEAFRSAAAALLDRLARDPAQQSRRDAWQRLADALEGLSSSNALSTADALLSALGIDHPDQLEYLAAPTSDARLRLATAALVKHASVLDAAAQITADVSGTLARQQKAAFLRQQQAAIVRELRSLEGGSADQSAQSGQAGPSDPELDDDSGRDADELAGLKRAVSALPAGSEVRTAGVREWRRMQRTPSASAEHGVIRSYLEWLVALPWNPPADDNELTKPGFLARARAQLDADHFGLDKVKRRLIEHLAVVRLRQLGGVPPSPPPPSARAAAETGTQAADVPTAVPDAPAAKRTRAVKGPILLFVGPPGVGKTSLGQSIARALGRPFQRISLGGVRDEAEIRGHRRTYVASGPGALAHALRRAGRPDPVILLDEIDKVAYGAGAHGDPAAALLEVLDPEQNANFMDHYINVPIDLSQVLFVCTANTLDTVAMPLLDRCEIVWLAGYTHNEKMRIADRFLMPKTLDANGMTPENVKLSDAALDAVVTKYTHEAGVRGLERRLGAVVRHKALAWAEHTERSVDASLSTDVAYNPAVDEPDLLAILGPPYWTGEEREREARPGLVYGLVVDGWGEGATLPVETAALPGSGQLKLTGSLGHVISESAELALSWVRAHARPLGLVPKLGDDPLRHPRAIDVHLHLPAGAQRKDGPSAGIAMVCAFVSLLSGVCVSTDTAMTGEITLRGRVAPVGGIKEKVLGAHRAHIKKVILPAANQKDVEQDVPTEVRAALSFVFVRTLDDVLAAAFGDRLPEREARPVLLESRL